MKKIKGVRIAAPVLAMLLGAMAIQGCSDDPTDSLGGCEADLRAKADAVGDSVDALVAVSGSMKATLHAACTEIATGTADMKADPTNDEVEAACEAAATLIGMVQGSAGVTITLQPAECSVNASAQLDCEANCDVSAMCMPGTIEARCTPGELTVACEGECTGELRCEASGSASVACEGTCGGTCTGTCEGTCNGACDGTCSAMGADGECAGTCDGECTGSCSATCTGTCQGSCTFEAMAMAECDGEARCKGECSVDGTAPECEANLMPPACEMDADCEAACEGQASFEAECTPPTVTVTGFADADVQARIVARLPAILEVLGKAQLAAEAAVGVGEAAANFAVELSGAATCAASLGGAFIGKLEAAASASVEVNVSVMASANCSGAASGST